MSVINSVYSLPVQSRLCLARALPAKRSIVSRRALVVTVRGDFGQSGEHSKHDMSFQELQNSGFDSSTSSFSNLHRDSDQQQGLARREEQLWQRQEALWQQQLAHWQHERSTWAQHEAALLVHIQELHSHLTAITTHHIQRNSTLSSQNLQLNPIQPLQPSETDIRRQAEADAAQAAPSTAKIEHSTQDRVSDSLDQSAQSLGSAAQPAAAEQSSSISTSNVQPPEGPPPALCLGSDDIYWVHQLQSGLMDQGYYSGEEEMEDFVFAEGTQSAVLAFQAVCGLEESGVVDQATWRALLGDAMTPTAPPIDEELTEETPNLPPQSSFAPSTPKKSSDAKDANPWQASWGDLFSSEESDTEFDTDSSPSSSSTAASGMASQSFQPAVASGASSTAQADPASGTGQGQWTAYVNEDNDYSKWTVLREGDGGRHVHELQAALAQQGFWPGDDDMLWWQFGSDTCSAVQTFQATANLPESGVVTSDTWQALLGPDATPIDAKNLTLNDEMDDDMMAEHEGAVYLVGEQRWSRPNMNP